MSSFTKPLAHLDLPTRLLVRVVSFGGRSIKAENDILVKSTSDPLIFVFNHNNYLETLQVGSYLLAHRQGKKPAFISDWMYGRLPVFA
jgi:hypothetical protein